MTPKICDLLNIPDILEVFDYEFSEEDKKRYHELRGLRNDLAHGKISEVPLEKALNENEFLRKLAISIDKHLVINFFVIEL